MWEGGEIKLEKGKVRGYKESIKKRWRVEDEKLREIVRMRMKN